jgi:ABC-type oligopeptide transport system substrate-binding subunit
MMRSTRFLATVLAVASAALAACGQEAAEAAPEVAAVTAVEVEGSDLKRLTLSEQAAERLGIVTEAVTEDPGSGQLLIPYSALMYDASGVTWTYTNPEGLIFIREQVVVELIDGDLARLTAGPEADTLVVTIGAAELWGVETGVGGGH